MTGGEVHGIDPELVAESIVVVVYGTTVCFSEIREVSHSMSLGEIQEKTQPALAGMMSFAFSRIS